MKRKEECLLSKSKKIFLVIAVLSSTILSFIGGQSYSKYVSSVRGDGMAEVATWSFRVNGQEEVVQTIPLVSTANDNGILDHKIAPGTSGSFNIMIDATGAEVGIDYQIKFVNETNKPTNLKFIYQNLRYNTTAELEEVLSGTIHANDTNKTIVLTIGWEWEYQKGDSDIEVERNDAQDTQDAKNIANYTFDIIVSGTQVIPQT